MSKKDDSEEEIITTTTNGNNKSKNKLKKDVRDKGDEGRKKGKGDKGGKKNGLNNNNQATETKVTKKFICGTLKKLISDKDEIRNAEFTNDHISADNTEIYQKNSNIEGKNDAEHEYKKFKLDVKSIKSDENGSRAEKLLNRLDEVMKDYNILNSSGEANTYFDKKAQNHFNTSVINLKNFCYLSKEVFIEKLKPTNNNQARGGEISQTEEKISQAEEEISQTEEDIDNKWKVMVQSFLNLAQGIFFVPENTNNKDETPNEDNKLFAVNISNRDEFIKNIQNKNLEERKYFIAQLDKDNIKFKFTDIKEFKIQDFQDIIRHCETLLENIQAFDNFHKSYLKIENFDQSKSYFNKFHVTIENIKKGAEKCKDNKLKFFKFLDYIIEEIEDEIKNCKNLKDLTKIIPVLQLLKQRITDDNKGNKGLTIKLEKSDNHELKSLNMLAKCFPSYPYSAVVLKENDKTIYVQQSSDQCTVKKEIEKFRECLKNNDQKALNKFLLENINLILFSKINSRFDKITKNSYTSGANNEEENNDKEEALKDFEENQSFKEGLLKEFHAGFVKYFIKENDLTIPENYTSILNEVFDLHGADDYFNTLLQDQIDIDKIKKYGDYEFEFLESGNQQHVEVSVLSKLLNENKNKLLSENENELLSKKENTEETPNYYIGLANNYGTEPSCCAGCSAELFALSKKHNIYVSALTPTNIPSTENYSPSKMIMDDNENMMKSYFKSLIYFIENSNREDVFGIEKLFCERATALSGEANNLLYSEKCLNVTEDLLYKYKQNGNCTCTFDGDPCTAYDEVNGLLSQDKKLKQLKRTRSFMDKLGKELENKLDKLDEGPQNKRTSKLRRKSLNL